MTAKPLLWYLRGRMKTLHAVLLVPAFPVLIAGCNTSSASIPPATPAPVVSKSREVRKELNTRLEEQDKVFHVGCRDEEKGACMDTSRVCPTDPKKAGAVVTAAAKKGPVAIEWEEPRVTWEKNEGVDSQYWFVKPDGSGTHYWRVPAPDDTTIDCGNGVYCGWHKADHAAGTLVAGGALALTPRGATAPIADLGHCPEPPPQPDYGQ